jgi:hypothetical protein
MTRSFVNQKLTLARPVSMIDRHYGHLARDGREHAIRLLDQLREHNVHGVDVSWTPPRLHPDQQRDENAA